MLDLVKGVVILALQMVVAPVAAATTRKEFAALPNEQQENTLNELVLIQLPVLPPK